MISREGGNWVLTVGPVGVSGNIELEQKWLTAIQHIFQVFCMKQQDYGPENIACAGEVGVAVRCMDKVARLRNLDGKDPLYEATEDTWVDLADYGVIGYMVHRGWWPKPKEEEARCPSCGK